MQTALHAIWSYEANSWEKELAHFVQSVMPANLRKSGMPLQKLKSGVIMT